MLVLVPTTVAVVPGLSLTDVTLPLTVRVVSVPAVPADGDVTVGPAPPPMLAKVRAPIVVLSPALFDRLSRPPLLMLTVAVLRIWPWVARVTVAWLLLLLTARWLVPLIVRSPGMVTPPARPVAVPVEASRRVPCWTIVPPV